MLRQFRLMLCMSVIVCSLAGARQAAAKQPTSDEATIGAIIKSGKFMLPKREQVARIMTSGRYYGMRVDLKYHVDNHDLAITKFAGDTASEMQTLVNPLGITAKLTDVRVWLWKEPDSKVVAAAQSRAKRVIAHIYTEIEAISNTSPELALFDKDHVKVTDQDLIFAPNENRTSKVSRPYILIESREPLLGVETQALFPSALFPLQKLQLTWIIYMEDETLKNRIISIVNNASQPLIDAEQAMGGSPIKAVL